MGIGLCGDFNESNGFHNGFTSEKILNCFHLIYVISAAAEFYRFIIDFVIILASYGYNGNILFLNCIGN